MTDAEQLRFIREAVARQADDETLWSANIPGQEFKIGIGEAYIQQSLRWLHKVIEDLDQVAFKNIIMQSNDEL